MSFSDPAGLRRLTTDGKLKFAPAFSGPDELVYAVHEVPNQVVLMRLRLSDGHRERFHPERPEHQFDPAFSRDGKRHAFILSAGSPQLLLVLQDRVNRKEARVVPQDPRAVARCPSWHPGEGRVVFHLSDASGQQIASTDAEGGDFRRLTSAAGIYASPACSPDGRTIAFSSSRDGDYELYAMDPDGSRQRRLTRSPGLDLRPAWSPDSGRLAFTSNRDGHYAIYVMDADGVGARRLTNGLEREDYATWHPDGRGLVIVWERAGRSDLYLIPAPN
jgi:TolB protein